MRKLFFLCSLVCVLCLSSVASPTNFLWGDSASSGRPYLSEIDPTTGAVIATFNNLAGGINGRGVVVVGNIAYYTDASDNNVYKYDVSTSTDLGVAFSVAGAGALSTIAYDGANFWLANYSGTNQTYQYTPTGTLLKTLNMVNCSAFCDGLEFFKNAGVGYLIENRGDGVGPYDVYDLNGNLITSALLPGTGFTTGIAFDGTHFFTSSPTNGSVSEWNMNGTFVQTLTLTGGSPSPLIEDLSFNYQQVLGTPEPTSLSLLGTGILGLAGVLRRKLMP
jgi:hypothetical protein